MAHRALSLESSGAVQARPAPSVSRRSGSPQISCQNLPLSRQVQRSLTATAASLSMSLPLTGQQGLPSASSEPSSSQPPRHASNDPSSSGENVTVIRSPEELAHFLADNPSKLVILMCKAIGCRPCKMFARKYQRVAASYSDCLFLEVTGDETTNLRKMMIQMGVRATPTFRLYREGECVKIHVGIDESKLRNVVKECLTETEAGYEAKDESSP